MTASYFASTSDVTGAARVDDIDLNYKMKIMRQMLLTSSVLCACIMAQVPTDIFQKAPPDIESALRSRVSTFLQAHVDGKFRMAIDLVADDSKDYYFQMEKQRYLGFEIVKIDYTDNFTKAKVLASVELMWRLSARLPPQRVKPPLQMLWKFENGDWYWYVVETTKWDTPWGTMRFPGAGEQNDPAAKVVEELRTMDPKAILGKVKADRREIALKSYEKATDSVEISNGLQGPISLRLESPGVSGLDAKLDRTELKAGETARLTFHYSPVTKEPKPPAKALVHVEPTGQRLQFEITFAIPPEVQKALPK